MDFYYCLLVEMKERASMYSLEQNFLKVLFKHLPFLKFHPGETPIFETPHLSCASSKFYQHISDIHQGKGQLRIIS
jgi:hypothetical protein